MSTAVSRFINGPATSTAKRFHGVAAASPPATFGSFSPLGLTKPPSGSQFSVKRVPRQVKRVIAPGVGKPNPNSSTSILHQRATM
jgi:hypothetical protein